jgi:hypothetical protein
VKAHFVGFLSGIALLISLLAVSGALAQNETALLRTVHASPDAPAVDVYIDGTLVEGLSGGEFFSVGSYVDVPAGDHTVQVALTGTSVNEAVITDVVVLESANTFTFAVAGTMDSLQTALFEDTMLPTASGNARVSVYHLAPSVLPVDVRLANGTPLAPRGLGFGNSAAFPLTAGTYAMVAYETGTETVLTELPPAEEALAAGIRYDIFLAGTPDNSMTTMTTIDVGIGGGVIPEEQPTAAPGGVIPAEQPTAAPGAPASLESPAETAPMTDEIAIPSVIVPETDAQVPSAAPQPESSDLRATMKAASIRAAILVVIAGLFIVAVWALMQFMYRITYK